MPALLRDRIVVVWIGLVLATTLSVFLGTDHGLSSDDGKKTGTSLVFAVAFLKIHFIGIHFMELRDAPLALRLAFEAWCLIVGSVVIVLYLTG